ncbi:uncharacterized protein LOC124885765 [Capsicum annuum]|uniref:uncharacterized protein LOC124885765 n=1 Tax=Capsicum annuum TaxID=4072 RepID=UPI001FB0A9FB|nr:uncharacterized protein LOC124885765 [Capsicum annuum]
MESSNHLAWASSIELWYKGQGVQDHLNIKASVVDEKEKSSAEDAKAKEQWEKVDAQLCSLLRRSIDSKLMPLFCSFQTCYRVWEKSRALYTNDISHFYDAISRMTNLQKQKSNISTDLGQVQAGREEFDTLMPITADVKNKKRTGWKQAMINEMSALYASGTWELVSLPTDILEKTGMTGYRPIDTPMDPNAKLLLEQGEPLSDPKKYRQLVVKLNHLTVTRSDISFSVSVVSQFMNFPCDNHWDAVVCTSRYIKSALGKGLLFEDRGHEHIIGYTDADQAGSPSDRCSTSEYCVLVGGNLVSWKCKKQSVAS